jgi:hypothetical protein
MSREYIINDSIVACLAIPNPEVHHRDKGRESFFAGLSDQLRSICTPDSNAVIIFEGQTFHPCYANNDDPATGCSWVGGEHGAGTGQLILSLAVQPEWRVRLWIQFKVAKDDSEAWLTVDYNPTSLFVGHNVHPAPGVIDPVTGEASLQPSSEWNTMTRVYRLGFYFLEAVAGVTLFEGKAKADIERGEIHLVRAQWAAAKPVKNISQFLQLICVIYGQTIARGEGIISNSSHLGMEFEPYPDLETHLVNGVKFRKFYGNKPLFSVSLYDKRANLEQKHQSLENFTVSEVKTVDGTVREDITAHSEGILVIVKAAQRQLRGWGAKGRKYFDFIKPDLFLGEEPRPTVWWLQRSICVLSHYWRGGKFVRFSFGCWLVPYAEDDILHFDVISDITWDGFQRMLALRDKVAEAWRNDMTPGADDWVGRYAEAAGCSRGTVRNRRADWREENGIDIAYPFGLYRDILFFGHNSIADPKNITKLLVAVENEDGKAVVRFHAEAIADFERKRVEIVNPALASRPWAMELKNPSTNAPELEPLDLDLDLDLDLEELEEVSLIEPIAPKKSLALTAPKRLGGGAASTKLAGARNKPLPR